MLADFMKIVQAFMGSSYLLRAHGKGGASATTLSFLLVPPPEKIAGGFQQAGKKGRGSGGRNFCPPANRAAVRRAEPRGGSIPFKVGSHCVQ